MQEKAISERGVTEMTTKENHGIMTLRSSNSIIVTNAIKNLLMKEI